MILADTSVWVDHLRRRNPQMARHLRNGQVVTHPFIVAEIALGSLHNRRTILDGLDSLLTVNVAQIGEVRRMIEAHSLYSKGIGLTDAHLIASCLITQGTYLWTLDRKLDAVAKQLGIRSAPPR
ncbi:MAG: type II toxin-antitoxin system VapC family toxin [Acidobacteriota bacterium]